MLVMCEDVHRIGKVSLIGLGCTNNLFVQVSWPKQVDKFKFTVPGDTSFVEIILCMRVMCEDVQHATCHTRTTHRPRISACNVGTIQNILFQPVNFFSNRRLSPMTRGTAGGIPNCSGQVPFFA